MAMNELLLIACSSLFFVFLHPRKESIQNVVGCAVLGMIGLIVILTLTFMWTEKLIMLVKSIKRNISKYCLKNTKEQEQERIYKDKNASVVKMNNFVENNKLDTMNTPNTRHGIKVAKI